MFLNFLRRKKISSPDGKYTFHNVAPPTPGTQSLVFDREFQDPVYYLYGPGKGVQKQWMRTEHPQLYVNLVTPIYGPGGVPVPRQSFILQQLSEDGN